MKQFKSVILVKHPVETVWQTIRDRLPEMVQFLDDVKDIKLESRTQNPNSLQLINVWQADIILPTKVQTILETDSVKWTDRAEWFEENNLCQWSIEPHFFKDRIDCKGSTQFESAIGGRGTRITFGGELVINTKDIPGVPAFMESTVTKTVESIITTLIPKNFRKITDALSILLKQQAD